MLRALLLALTAVLTVSCTAAGDLTTAETTTQDTTTQDTTPQDATPQEATPSPAEESVEPSSPTLTPTPAASPPPSSGSCRVLRPRDLNTVVNDTPTVPCKQRHTAVTFHVGKLPAGAVEGATSSGDDKVEAAAERMCSREFSDYVGGTRGNRMLTSLRSTFFLPDAEQFDLGARWVRCDLFAYADDTALAELPGRLKGALDNADLRADLGICSRVSPKHPKFMHIICTRDHQWRAVSRVRLGKEQAKFPGGPELSDQAAAACRKVVRNYLDTREAFSYGFEVPRRESWADGDRFGFCWAETPE